MESRRLEQVMLEEVGRAEHQPDGARRPPAPPGRPHDGGRLMPEVCVMAAVTVIGGRGVAGRLVPRLRLAGRIGLEMRLMAAGRGGGMSLGWVGGGVFWGRESSRDPRT